MFRYQARKIITKGGKLEVSNVRENISHELTEVLNEYENYVLGILRDCGDFPYVIGKLDRNAFNQITSSKRHEYYLHTRHSNYTGGIVINQFLNYTKDSKDHYVITFKNPISKFWMDSSSSINHIVDNIEALLLKVELKKEIEFISIEIFESSAIDVYQTNPGKSKAYYRLK